MPEIRHNFTAGKMNKDLDERLVRNGEYRDAMNIQVRTTEGDSLGDGDAGTVQNIEGNSSIGEAYRTTGYNGLNTKFVGAVANEKTDKAYFFAAAPVPSIPGKNVPSILHGIGPSDLTAAYNKNNKRVWVDSIIEVDTNLDSSIPIFQDIFAVTGDKWDFFYAEDGDIFSQDELAPDLAWPSTSGYTSFQIRDASQIRIGMKV